METLKSAGAEFAAIAANTPHIVFDEVDAQSPLPLLSIVEATFQKAQTLGIKRIGLPRTKFTMESDFYSRTFARGGIQVTVPTTAE